MMTKEELPICPVETALKVIGSKWKLLIISELLNNPKRFNELQKRLSRISHKVLTENLKEMESDGVIIRTIYPETPPKVEYSLSDLGSEIRILMDFISVWGTEYQKYIRNQNS